MANKRIGTEITGPNRERFRIESRLGSGSFGEVYRAVGVTSGMLVAVKMVPAQKLEDPTTLAVRTVLNEVRADMVKINHPNVVRILHVDSGTDSKVGPYVMMEYVGGGTLHALLDRRRGESKPFTLNEAVSLMRGIALGTQAVNEHLVHRDIKPDNILLDGPADAPRPRIADFGIAKVASDPTRPETFKGIQPVWYMAPEVWRGETNTRKIDVYSAGLVFYEVLTLEHPLLSYVRDPTDWVKWREVHLSVPCPDVRAVRPEIPLSLAKLIMRMTDKSPGNRPDWDEVLAGLILQASPPKRTVALDPQLLAASRRLADERLREEHAKSAAELERQREAERHAARREEYTQSAKRLLDRCDEIVEAVNLQEASYPIRIAGDGTLSRVYALPNERELRCEMFGFSNYAARGSGSRLLGAGYIGTDGGLSANMILSGQPDDVASANWFGVEVTIHALLNGQGRLKWYKEAGLADETIKFVEFMDDDNFWRRDIPSFFGIKRADVFYGRYERVGDVYNFRTAPDVIGTFQQLLTAGLQMPKRLD